MSLLDIFRKKKDNGSEESTKQVGEGPYRRSAREQCTNSRFIDLLREGQFCIEELNDRYRLHNLEDHNGAYTIDWSKRLLENSRYLTQEESTRQNTEWNTPSMPLYNATITTLFENRDHSVSEQRDLVQAVREMLQQDFKKHWMMTSTRVKYAANGKDTITHDWNTPQAREVQGNFAGPNGYVKPGCGFNTILEAILESNDLSLIKQAYEWIGQEGKKPYLWRINSKPETDRERPVVLGIDGGSGFNIDAGDIVVYVKPARGVVAERSERD